MQDTLDPAEFFENIEDDKKKAIELVMALLQGTTNEFENIGQVLDDFAWTVKAVVQQSAKEL